MKYKDIKKYKINMSSFNDKKDFGRHLAKRRFIFALPVFGLFVLASGIFLILIESLLVFIQGGTNWWLYEMRKSWYKAYAPLFWGAFCYLFLFVTYKPEAEV